MAVIGISCYFHDSAAAVISDNGEILGAVQEERFSRKKHDPRFPSCSVDYCLKLAKDNDEEVTKYVYYEKPIRIFMRLLETYFNTAPRGLSSFYPAMQSWISEKLFTKENVINEISKLDSDFSNDKLCFSEHHLSHAASAFYPSPFKKSVVLCMDAVGEWATTTAWIGDDNDLKPIWEIDFPHSIGMLYSAFTYYCGFKVNSGEYKLMGLAPYGKPKYAELILDKLIRVFDDGSFKLDMSYFKFHRGLRMISSKFIKLFGHPARSPQEEITEFYMDIASSIQKVTENIVVKIAKNLRQKHNVDNLCLAGGVALNCVANGKILDKAGFKNIWVQPASGDSGNALGSALAYQYIVKKSSRKINKNDSMKSAYLGPSFSNEQIKNYLDALAIKYHEYSNDQLCIQTAKSLDQGNVIGWFQGRMEYGPRALGHRSIIGDPRNRNMQKIMNLKIKNRESFRPFAPAILDGFQDEYFNIKVESPYMLLTRQLQNKFLKNESSLEGSLSGLDKLKQIRSTIPAITHVDNSCRVQTVSKERNPLFYQLINSFYELTNCPLVINTSFNVRGEPVVCTPEDALKCFIFTEMDVLVLGSFMVKKSDIPKGIDAQFARPTLIED